MSTKRLTILGTSAQVPTRTRNHSGYFLQWDRQGILLDPGEGTQRQMRLFGVKPSSITKILISHFHGDHCFGLPGVIQRLCLDGVTHQVDVYFPASGSGFYNNLVNATNYKGRINLCSHPIETEGIVFEDQNCRIDSYPLNHPIDTLGYRVKEHDGVTLIPDKLDNAGIAGRSIGQFLNTGEIEVEGEKLLLKDFSHPKPGQVFAFITDTAECDALQRISKNADLLLCEATYLSEHQDLARTYGHLTASQAAATAKAANVKILVLTHFSQRYSHWDAFLSEAKSFIDTVYIANDGDVFNFPSTKRKR